MLMENKDLIIKLNDLKKKLRKSLNPPLIKQIGEVYGKWVDNKDKRIIIGRDLRPNGEFIKDILIQGLYNVGCKIIDLDICPTPVFFYIKNKLDVKGSIIISDSNKPLNWNKIKLYLGEDHSYHFELEDINKTFNNIDLKTHNLIQDNQFLEKINPISTYIADLFDIFDFERIQSQNNLRVIVDPGAGVGKFITPKVLENLGCEVLVINDELDKYDNYPRELYPIKANLKDLILALWKGNYDVGFAHDFDANKLAVIGDNFQCYSEEIISALIVYHYIKQKIYSDKTFVFLLNLASSLRFEVLAEQYNIQVLKTYAQNQFSKERFTELVSKGKKYFIFGSKGLKGGPIFPYFNRVKDGIFITAKLIKLLVESGEKLSQLISKLPKFYSFQEKVTFSQKKLDNIIRKLNEELTKEGETVTQIDNNLRFGHEKDWFVLISPSNNSIKVFSEAKRESLARLYCETTTELLKLVISKL